MNKTEENAKHAFGPQPISTGVIIKWTDSNQVMAFVDGKKVAMTRGHGYDKVSYALANALRFLYPNDSRAHQAIWGRQGAGVAPLQRELSKLGWELKLLTWAKGIEVYTLRKA